mgnify:CR=1 FL=1
MRGKGLWLPVSWVLSLLVGSFLICASVGAAQTELWKNQSFIKKARAIEAGDWEDVEPKEVAIAGLYEMARTVERVESRLESEVARLYSFARLGILVLAAYLVIQLLATLAILIKLGRKTV